jgi:hypothetical protein
MATIQEQVEIEIKAETNAFKAEMRGLRNEFAAFTQVFQNNSKNFGSFLQQTNFTKIADALGSPAKELKIRFSEAFKSMHTESNVAAVTLKKNFYDIGYASGLTTNQITNQWRKSFGEVEKLVAKTERFIDKSGEARRRAFEVLAHSLPFGTMRTAAWTAVEFGNFKNLGSDAENATGAVAAFSGALKSIPVPVIIAAAFAFKAITGAIELTKKALFDFIGPALAQGLQYNDLLENTKYGMAGLILQMTELRKNGQEITGEQERWNASVEISAGLQKQLQNSALQTKVIYSDLARGMQEGFGPLLQMGVQQNEISPFVTRFVQAMTTLRVPLREIGQEIRAFSNLETNPRVARVSFAMISQAAKQMGVDVETAKSRLQELKREGKLDDWFIANSRGMAIASKDIMGTVSGQLSNFAELKDRLLGEGTTILYKQVAASLEQIMSIFVKIDQQGNATFREGLVESVKIFSAVLAGALNILTLYAKSFALLFQPILSISNLIDKQLSKYPKIFGKDNPFYNPVGGVSAKAVNDAGFNASVSFGQGFNQGGYSFYNPTSGDVDKVGEDNPNKWQIKPGLPSTGKYAEMYRAYGALDNPDVFAQWWDEYQRKLKDNLDKANSAREKAAEAQMKFFEDWFKMAEKLHITSIQEFGKFGADPKNRSFWSFEWYADARRKEQIDVDWATEGSRAKEFPLLSGQGLENSWLTRGNTILGSSLTQYNIERQGELFEKNAKVFNENVDRYFRGPMKNIFAELGTTGGKNFMQVMASNFDSMVQTAAENLSNILTGGELSVTYNEKGEPSYFQNGKAISPEDYTKLNKRQAGVNAAMAGANLALGSYAAGRTNAPGSMTAGLIGGAMTGAGVGQMIVPVVGAVVGAIVGAIVGYIAAAMGKAAARDEYKYLAPYISARGRVSLDYRTKNMEPAEEAELEARIQDRLDTFWNGYLKLALKFTTDFIPKLADLAGVWKIQDTASKNMLKHFEEWMNGDFPRAIADLFEPALKAASIQLGMTGEKFTEIWNRLQGLDPQKALELVTALFTALENFKKFQDTWWLDSSGLGISNNPFSRMVEQQGINMRQGRYVDRFQTEGIRLEKMAAAVSQMTGEAQLRGMQELSEGLIGMIQEAEALARQFAAFLLDSGRQFGSLRRDLTMQTMGTMGTDEQGNPIFKPDLNAQRDYLNTYLQTIMDNIGTAGSLEELQYWQGEFFRTFGQMQGLAQEMGPEAYQSFLKWALGENGEGGILAQFDSAIAGQVTKWNDALDTQIAGFVTRMGTFISDFQTKLDGAGNSAGGAGKDLDDTVPIIRKFKGALEDVIPVLEELAKLVTGGTEIEPTTIRSDSGFEGRTISRRVIKQIRY